MEHCCPLRGRYTCSACCGSIPACSYGTFRRRSERSSRPNRRRSSGCPSCGLLIAVSFTSALLWRAATLGSHSFWELFAYVFGVLLIFNLVDLLILDWLIVCWIEPRWAILPGTEHVVFPKQYLHHFKGFLMGTVGLVIVGLAIAALLSIGRSCLGTQTDQIRSPDRESASRGAEFAVSARSVASHLHTFEQISP
jgi:hypothetical protein